MTFLHNPNSLNQLTYHKEIHAGINSQLFREVSQSAVEK